MSQTPPTGKLSQAGRTGKPPQAGRTGKESQTPPTGKLSREAPATELSEDEQAAWRSYLSAHARLLAHLDRRLRDRTGCTLAEYEVLVHVSEAPGRRIRQVDLADAMQWEKSRLSHQITRMEERGLVRRRPSPVDARGTDVLLTASGLRTIEAQAPHHAADVMELFVSPLGATKLAGLGTASQRILGALDDAEASDAGSD